ncbi:phage minor tail protein L [Escherichia coli]
MPQETHHETTRLTQSAQVVLWEIDLTEVGGERYFFCNEQNEKGEPVTWQGRQYQAYPIQGTGFELNGKGSAARPTLTVSNLHGMVTGMAEDLQSLVGGTVVRRKVYARFLDAVNFVNGNSDADPEQEVISRWRIEQCSELSAVSASFVLSTPTETDGAVFPGRIMLANTCTWTYRGDECGYSGPATRWHEDSVRNRWFSVMAGPSVRVNEWFSAYAMAGMAYSRVSTFSGDYLRVTDNKGKTHDVLTGSDDGRHSNTSLAWGAGVQFNPTESVAIDVAYEGSGSGDWRTDGFIVGVGYKF